MNISMHLSLDINYILKPKHKSTNVRFIMPLSTEIFAGPFSHGKLASDDNLQSIYVSPAVQFTYFIEESVSALYY
jgi:hypothetical protein